MLIGKKLWWLLTLGVTGLVSGAIVLTTAFVPKLDNLIDPLGRPSELSNEVIFSASEFERLSAILVPKHTELSNRISVLNGVATELATLVDRAGTLAPASVDVNKDTGKVVDIADPLPGLIGDVTGRAEQANSAVSVLDKSVGSVTNELMRVLETQRVVYKSLQSLGPRAEEIAKILNEIEESSEHIGPLAPLLGVVSQMDTQQLTGLLGGK